MLREGIRFAIGPSFQQLGEVCLDLQQGVVVAEAVLEQEIDDPTLVEEFATVRYAPNTYVLMLNTHDSLHGVTVRQSTPHIRRFAVTSGWFPGVDESSLLGRRRGLMERLKAVIRPVVARPTVAEYQD